MPYPKFILARMLHQDGTREWVAAARPDAAAAGCMFIVHNAPLAEPSIIFEVFTGDAEIPWSRHIDDGVRFETLPLLLTELEPMSEEEHIYLLLRQDTVNALSGPFPLAYCGPHPYAQPGRDAL